MGLPLFIPFIAVGGSALVVSDTARDYVGNKVSDLFGVGDKAESAGAPLVFPKEVAADIADSIANPNDGNKVYYVDNRQSVFGNTAIPTWVKAGIVIAGSIYVWKKL